VCGEEGVEKYGGKHWSLKGQIQAKLVIQKAIKIACRAKPWIVAPNKKFLELLGN
jgi:nitrous oxidase accessory protein NosD